MKKILSVVASVAAVATPAIAFAQTSSGTNTFNGSYITSFLSTVQGWVPIVTGILFALAFIYFVWGVISYVISGDADKKEGAKSVMIYGIVGLAVISLAGGIIFVLGNVFGVSGSNSITAPTINTPVINNNSSQNNFTGQ
jgi:hypothetical protein